MGIDAQRFAARHQRRAKEHFLIVEDDPVCRRFCATILSSLGYQALLASNPETALTHFRSTAVAGVLLDWNIPYPGSLALLYELSKVRADKSGIIPVIIMSADDQLSIKQLEAFGATELATIPAILKKPFTATELQSVICPQREKSAGASHSEQQRSRMKPVFLHHLCKDMLLLDEMISANKRHEALQLLHRLHGAASMMGLVVLGQLCMKLTACFRDPGNHYQWTETYLQLIQEANELLTDQHVTAEQQANYSDFFDASP